MSREMTELLSARPNVTLDVEEVYKPHFNQTLSLRLVGHFVLLRNSGLFVASAATPAEILTVRHVVMSAVCMQLKASQDVSSVFQLEG